VPSTGTQQAANRGARVHTPRVPATMQRPGALAAAGALRRAYVDIGSNIKTRTGPPQAVRPVRLHHNRTVAPPGPPSAALNPANQTPRAVPLHRRGPSLATAKGPHHVVREVDAMADSGQNRRFTLDCTVLYTTYFFSQVSRVSTVQKNMVLLLHLRSQRTFLRAQQVNYIISEASSGDPFAFSTLRQPRCIKWMALIGLMVTL